MRRSQRCNLKTSDYAWIIWVGLLSYLLVGTLYGLSHASQTFANYGSSVLNIEKQGTLGQEIAYLKAQLFVLVVTLVTSIILWVGLWK